MLTPLEHTLTTKKQSYLHKAYQETMFLLLVGDTHLCCTGYTQKTSDASWSTSSVQSDLSDLWHRRICTLSTLCTWSMGSSRSSCIHLVWVDWPWCNHCRYSEDRALMLAINFCHRSPRYSPFWNAERTLVFLSGKRVVRYPFMRLREISNITSNWDVHMNFIVFSEVF